ncbi:MAG: nitrilase-related carbon-nitrogen hydrolase [Alkalilacustris sp.]
MTVCRLALWQGAGVAGDLRATVAEVARVAQAAAGADLLVFPEGFLTGYHVPGLSAATLAGVEAALGDVRAIAARTGVGLVLGTHVLDGTALRNAAVVIGPDGAETGRYFKQAVFGPWEKATFTPGTTRLLFSAGGLRVGVAICYDVEFPEIIRPYARAGADLVVVPTALMDPQDRIPRQMVPVRALENQIFLGYANRTGAEPGLTYPGLSCICGPWGEDLARAGPAPTLLTADLDPARLRAARAEYSYLDDLAGLPGARPAG